MDSNIFNCISVWVKIYPNVSRFKVQFFFLWNQGPQVVLIIGRKEEEYVYQLLDDALKVYMGDLQKAPKYTCKKSQITFE